MAKDKPQATKERSKEHTPAVCWNCGYNVTDTIHLSLGICNNCLAHLRPDECSHCMEKYERLNHG